MSTDYNPDSIEWYGKTIKFGFIIDMSTQKRIDDSFNMFKKYASNGIFDQNSSNKCQVRLLFTKMDLWRQRVFPGDNPMRYDVKKASITSKTTREIDDQYVKAVENRNIKFRAQRSFKLLSLPNNNTEILLDCCFDHYTGY